MKNNNPKERKTELYQAILQLKDMKECCDFFEDICAAAELRCMEQRFEVAKMLKQDKVYVEISQATNASSATISRVKRMLNSGTGCIGRIVDRMEGIEEKEEGED